jgi:hypothetical protein
MRSHTEGAALMWGVIMLAVLLSIVPIVSGQPLAPTGVRVLERVAVRLLTSDAVTGKGGTCQGSVYATDSQAAYIVTARHCAAIPAAGDPGYTGLRMRVYYPDRTQGRVEKLWRARTSDIVIVRASYSTRPSSWRDACLGCGFYQW